MKTDPRSLTIVRTLLVAAIALAPLWSGAQTRTYDVLIRNARIVDGTGGAWHRRDIALQGEAIAAMGRLGDVAARRVIDAREQVVAPGFIDIHSHARRTIFEVPTAENCIRQGVTTVIEGPDGSSPLPLKPFLEKLAAARLGINFGLFVGQGTIRQEVVGNVDRPATPEEVAKMKALVREAMLDGAFGLSTGLFYVPGNYTPTDEVIELARVAGSLGGIHISHMREESIDVLKSVAETIAIGEKGGLPTQVTHHKVVGVGNWGRSVDTLKMIAEARARGVDVSIDQYPYTASSTGIGALLPQWAQEGTREDVLRRLRDPATRARIKTEAVYNIRNNRGGGDPKNVVIARCAWDANLEGKNLAEISQLRGRSASVEDGAETAMELVEKGGASAIFHAINEEDVVRIMRDPLTMIASDGGVEVMGRGAPHPRSYGAFARVLGVYVREKQVLKLEDAVRKMSALPAARLGLYDRGVLRPGMKADLVVFDPATVRDRATFAKPHQYAEGVSYVFVNGALVLDEGKMTDARAGHLLRGASARK
ncbi:MAG: D-aminoacylase [Blastocatellia bacterium]|nr:D-aminoacylase [Blastocatellia bacterium]